LIIRENVKVHPIGQEKTIGVVRKVNSDWTVTVSWNGAEPKQEYVQDLIVIGGNVTYDPNEVHIDKAISGKSKKGQSPYPVPGKVTPKKAAKKTTKKKVK